MAGSRQQRHQYLVSLFISCLLSWLLTLFLGWSSLTGSPRSYKLILYLASSKEKVFLRWLFQQKFKNWASTTWFGSHLCPWKLSLAKSKSCAHVSNQKIRSSPYAKRLRMWAKKPECYQSGLWVTGDSEGPSQSPRQHLVQTLCTKGTLENSSSSFTDS